MIKICLDTNTLQNNWLATGEAFTLLGELIAKGECAIFLSEISILEHVRHYAKDAPQIEAKMKAGLGSYAKLFLEDMKIPALPPLYDGPTFEKRFRVRLAQLEITTLPIPALPHADLVVRDLVEKKPFTASGKGYRDALIWLSFLATIDNNTTKAILVTSNTNDFGSQDKSDLHPDLKAEIKAKNTLCEALWFPVPQKLVDELIKPLLKALAEEEAKTKKLLKRIQDGKYKAFKLEKIVAEGLDNFEAQEPEGTFYAGDESLEEPLYVTMVEDPTEIEATALYKLKSGDYLCEGTAEVTATVEGYLDKFEAFNQSELGHAFISNPHHNDHYSEVEVPNVPTRITFSFEFTDGDADIWKFEVTKVESIH
jgi:hypothetical protein